MKRITIFTIVFVAISFTPASATIINIPDDYPTIQQGIDASSDCDTVLVQPGWYIENINFNGHNIVLGSMFLTTGDTAYISQTVIDGNESGSVVSFENGEDSSAVITGFTIRNGNSLYGGGITCSNSSSPVITNNIITNNEVYTNNERGGSGGGIYCWNNSRPVIINNMITGNSSSIDGGGIYCGRSNPYIYNNIIDANIAGYSGGGINCSVSSSGLIADNSISNNSSGYGGGISCTDFSNTAITSNRIYENMASSGGGAIYCLRTSASIKYNIIYGNSSNLDGGGLYCDNSSSSIINSIFWANTAISGNEIYLQSGSLSITYCDIQGGWEGVGNIDIDPLLRDPDNGDFHLMATYCNDPYDSPCIDAGYPIYADSILDCSWGLGTERSDISAYSGGIRYGRIINVPADFPTIQEGINASLERDTVLVQPGVYVENIYFDGHNIVLGSLFLTTGDTSYISSTIIDGDSSGSVVTFQDGEDSTAAIIGFTIRNGYARFGGGINCVTSNPIIANNYICCNSVWGMENENSGYWMPGEGGGIKCYFSNPLIANNTITDNNASQGFWWGEGSAIWCKYSNPSIVQNIIINNNSNHSTIFCYGNISPSIINNTISHNIGRWLNCNNSDPIIKNSIAWANYPQGVSQYGSRPAISFCVIQGGWDGEGNIDINPLFINPYNNEYNVCSNSPCIDAGDPDLYDADGTRSDIGVFFYEHPECDNGNRWYISIEGDDLAGDGSIENPFRTIQHGINISTEYDTIIVENGTYYENISINSKGITLASKHIDSGNIFDIQNTIIDGSSTSEVINILLCDNSMMVTGFTIKNGFSERGGAVSFNYSEGNIYYNIISHNSATDGGGIGCYLSYPIINQNIIKENIASETGGAIYCRASNPKITNNIIAENNAGWGGGISCKYTNTYSFIVNNNIYGNSAANAGGGIYSAYSNPTIANSIIWANSASGQSDGIWCSPFFEINYCNIQDGWEGEGNIDIDPLFRDPDNGDFHLMAIECDDPYDSPCIDAGHPILLDSLLDCSWGLGTNRSDMGAYSGGDGRAPQDPELISPISGTIFFEEPIILCWHQVAYADSFKIQLSFDYLFEDIISITISADDTTYEITEQLANGPWYWRVKARNIGGWGSWSSSWRFHVLFVPPAPVLILPADGAAITEGPVSLVWHHIDYCDSFNIQLCEDTLFQYIIPITVSSNDTSCDVTDYMSYGEHWNWRVRAYNISGWGDWSEVWSFNVEFTSIDDPDRLIPDNYVLYQSYPNPFNNAATIKYGLPEQAYVNIQIYDILGRKVETLVNKEQAAGYHQTVWCAMGRSSGIYFYRIEAGDFTKTKKMLLVK